MEQQKQTDWHYNARVQLSHLVTSMCENFTNSHNATQTTEYQDLYEQYMQLQTDIKLHDFCVGGLKKAWRQIG